MPSSACKNKKHHPNDTHATPYMHDWLWTLMAADAIKRAGPNPTGEGVKRALYFFFFYDTATTEIYTLSLHDALPIFNMPDSAPVNSASLRPAARCNSSML